MGDLGPFFVSVAHTLIHLFLGIASNSQFSYLLSLFITNIFKYVVEKWGKPILFMLVKLSLKGSNTEI